jgi:hypothetical protein
MRGDKLREVFGKSVEELGFGEKSAEGALDPSPGEKAVLPSQVTEQVTNGRPSPVALDDPSAIAMVVEEARDWAAWFGMKQAQILTMIGLWRGRASFCDEIQLLVDQEIQMIDKELEQYNGKRQNWRRGLGMEIACEICLWKVII